jgi:hypothetical protein
MQRRVDTMFCQLGLPLQLRYQTEQIEMKRSRLVLPTRHTTLFLRTEVHTGKRAQDIKAGRLTSGRSLSHGAFCHQHLHPP